MVTITIYTDGGARGNPGPAAIGVVIRGEGIEIDHARVIGETTNNVAEYTAVIDAIEQLANLPQLRESSLQFYLDSQLVERQINGIYRIKEPSLRELYSKVKQGLQTLGRPYQFTHVPRAQNAQADALVNQVLDAA